MVAEKPSIATSIAHALGGPHVTSRNRSPPLYEFPLTFRGQPAQVRVTSVTGHLYSLEFAGKYQNWDQVEPQELFDAPTVHNCEHKGILHHLQREAKGCDTLILWMDCDREGENICFEVIRTVQDVMKKPSPQILRARFSAVTKKDIDHAMNNLLLPNENEAKSVDARQELDLKVGVAFSRFQTRYFQGKYGNLDSSIISYGPCQTPTLGFCVERYDMIQSFQPEPYWSLQVKIDASQPSSSSATTSTSTSTTTSSSMVYLQWQRGKLFDQSVVDLFAYMVRGDERLQCIEVRKKDSRRLRPQPLNTVELLKLASKQLGIGPQAAMRAAETLYLSGYLSYPRTESTAYPSTFQVMDTVRLLSNHPYYRQYIQDYLLIEGGVKKARAGHDAGDHPPITPVGVAHDLSGDMASIYDLVCRHFLATVSADVRYEVTRATFRGAQSGETFTVSGRKETDPGFMAILGRSRHDSSGEGEDYEEGDGEEGEERIGGAEGEEDNPVLYLENIPSFSKGAYYPIVSCTVETGQTRPPGFLTESDLIDRMEKHGIGTDASIPTHIQNILTRNYVTLGTGRTLIPTELGIVLVHGYLHIDPDLVLPDVRSAIEKYCSYIAKGLASKEEVVKQSLAAFHEKFDYFTHNIGKMDSLFEATFDPLAQSGKNLSKCGKCMRYMRYIPLKPQRLYCVTCEQTYSLPQNGTIKLYKETKCPLDGFELVLYSLGNSEKAQGKSFPLCPYCYNFPPQFKEEEEKEEGTTSGEGEEKVQNGEEGGSEEEEGEQSWVGYDDTLPNWTCVCILEGDEDDDDDESESGSEEEGWGRGHMGCNACMHPSCKQSAAMLGVGPCSFLCPPAATAPTAAPTPLEVKGNTDAGRGRGRGRGGRGGDHSRGGRGGRGGRGSHAPAPEPAPIVPEIGAYQCDGLMILDVNSKPNWKLACNECNTLLRFHAEIHSITVLARQPRCGQCQQSKLLEIEFHKDKSPLPGGETKCQGCPRCHPLLSRLTEVVIGRSINLVVLRKERARRRAMATKMGKGRRGGRGRGRGGKRKDKSSVLMSFEDF